MKNILIITIFFEIFKISISHALVPIESLVLGSFSKNYSEVESDPLNYIFKKEDGENSSKSTFKRELALYRGFYEEGKNLLNYCKNKGEIHYETEWHKVQVMRTVVSEFQYLSLDLISRALPKFAKALAFSSEEFHHLAQGLVGNYCSNNLSVISKKELLNNFLVKFEKESSYQLPEVTANPYFPDNFESYYSAPAGMEQEFKYTIKLFQAVCSWGGNPNNPQLMAPLLRNPALMALVFRQLDNQTIDWKEKENLVFIREDFNTVKIKCDNLICRKTNYLDFYKNINYSIGGTSLSEDLKRLYCEEFKNASFVLDPNEENDERLIDLLKSRTKEEENFINSQMIALWTGIPDFLLRIDKFSESEDILRSSLDYTFKRWALEQVNKYNREIYFEEPLILELVDRKLYFNSFNSKFVVAFDINLGEFDRTTQRDGKLGVEFEILVQRSFLHYYRTTLKNLGPQKSSEKDDLLLKLKKQLTKDLDIAREKFIIPPWRGDLEGLIAKELSDQLLLVPNRFFNLENSGFEPIMIKLNYGIFALKYLNHQRSVEKSMNAKSVKNPNDS